MSPQSLYPDLAEILVTRDNQDSRVAIVSLNRPPQRNAFTGEMTESLIEAYSRLDKDDSVKVIVLKGETNPGNAFCAGIAEAIAEALLGSELLHLVPNSLQTKALQPKALQYTYLRRAIAEPSTVCNRPNSADLVKGNFSTKGRYSGTNAVPQFTQHRDGGGRVALSTFKVAKPTIAAINGHAVGIGITMTLSFDIRVVWQDAKIGFVFAQRGIVPEATSSFLLPKLIGHSKAMELFMTAEVIPASSPALQGLWSSCQPSPEATVETALNTARKIANANSAISLALIKALVWRGKGSAEEQHLLDSRAMHVAGNSPDSIEGVKAFREKRKPQFAATIPADLPRELWPWWSEVDIVDRSKL